MQARSYAEQFSYRGVKLVGIFNRPAGPDNVRFPAVLFLHGYPGAEKNVDVQRALLERGVASFVLYFRGAWGSEGKYDFMDLPEQALAGLRFLSRQDFVDKKRLAVFGFSMGGWTALHVAAKADLRACVAVAPVGGPEMVGPDTRRVVGRMGRVLRVPRGVLAGRFIEAVRRRDPAKSARKRRCPLLIVHGMGDQVVPFLVGKRLAEAGGAKLAAKKGAGHDFLEHRRWLTALTSRWLTGRLK